MNRVKRLPLAGVFLVILGSVLFAFGFRGDLIWMTCGIACVVAGVVMAIFGWRRRGSPRRTPHPDTGVAWPSDTTAYDASDSSHHSSEGSSTEGGRMDVR